MAKRNGHGNGKSKGRRSRGSKWRRRMNAIRNGRRVRSTGNNKNKYHSTLYHLGGRKR